MFSVFLHTGTYFFLCPVTTTYLNNQSYTNYTRVISDTVSLCSAIVTFTNYTKLYLRKMFTKQ